MADLNALFNDRNFVNLLANFGTGLDPQGVAGALGRATTAYTGAQAAGERADKVAAAQEQQNRLIVDALRKGLTPPGTQGASSVSMGPGGNVKFDVDLRDALGTPTSAAPVAPPPVAPPVAAPAANPPPLGGVTQAPPPVPNQPTTPPANQLGDDIESLRPFYSALRRLVAGR
jgi:hypothetical protein